MNTTSEIMERGMDCLLDNLGAFETEQFISTILREKKDYTKWRQKYFNHGSSEAFQEAAVAYAKEHPFQGKKCSA